MIILLYFFIMVVTFLLGVFVNSIIGAIFQGNYKLIEFIITIIIDFIIGWRLGLYMGRRLLYIKLKKLYKNKKDKGE